MKFSANWLRVYVPGLQASGREIGKEITLKTAECEGVEEYGAHFRNVCAAKVLTVEPIPKSKNQKATVDTRRYGVKTVVCGAPNCRPDIVTAYVPAGTMGIEKAVVSGIESDGMLASGAELGLNRDDDGIIELFHLEPGQPIPGCIPDHIIDIDNKSLTHRPDLWGHFGMAREVAATFGVRLQDPVDLGVVPPVAAEAADGKAPLRVAIEDYALCPRYSALVFENVQIGESPLWLQYRLESVGLNPINNIVDVTNYVMAELGQPTHAFDADLLEGRNIYVRRARAGEKIHALNEEVYDLDEQALVIANGPSSEESKAEAIAGVIGGRPTGIHAGTTRVVLESANFQAASIRKTSTRLKVRTDASMRFEKAQDPHNTLRALARCMDLFALVSPGIKLAGGLVDNAAPLADPKVITLDLDWLDRKIGKRVEPQEVRRILEALQFTVSEVGPRSFRVTVPSWRATKDISLPVDLVEEIGRMIGYDSITPVPPMVPTAVPPPSAQRAFFHTLRSEAAAQGFTEVYHYSFLSDEQVIALGLDPAAHVRVLNPIASDQALMRTTLVPGILKNIQSNARHLGDFRLFEIGQEIHKQAEGLPRETPHLTAAIYSREGDGEPGLFELKRLAECLAGPVETAAVEANAYEHPKRTFSLSAGGCAIGRLFEFHPNVDLGPGEGRASVLDLDLNALEELRGLEHRYQPLRRFPESAFDLSVVCALREPVSAIEAQLRTHGGEHLVAIEFVRQYSGPPLEEGRKSVSYRVTVGAADRTLSSDEIAGIRDGLIDGLRASGYELRV
jgi:phenylalanyl-tRNA synthetase beta chain